MSKKPPFFGHEEKVWEHSTKFFNVQYGLVNSELYHIKIFNIANVQSFSIVPLNYLD